MTLALGQLRYIVAHMHVYGYNTAFNAWNVPSSPPPCCGSFVTVISVDGSDYEDAVHVLARGSSAFAAIHSTIYRATKLVT